MTKVCGIAKLARTNAQQDPWNPDFTSSGDEEVPKSREETLTVPAAAGDRAASSLKRKSAWDYESSGSEDGDDACASSAPMNVVVASAKAESVVGGGTAANVGITNGDLAPRVEEWLDRQQRTPLGAELWLPNVFEPARDALVAAGCAIGHWKTLHLNLGDGGPLAALEMVGIPYRVLCASEPGQHARDFVLRNWGERIGALFTTPNEAFASSGFCRKTCAYKSFPQERPHCTTAQFLHAHVRGGKGDPPVAAGGEGKRLCDVDACLTQFPEHLKTLRPYSFWFFFASRMSERTLSAWGFRI